MTFVKGWKGGPGRPKGKPNTLTLDIKAKCREMVECPAYQTKVFADLKKRKIEPALEQMIWHYAYGKPKESLELSWNLERLNDTELGQLESLVRRVS